MAFSRSLFVLVLIAVAAARRRSYEKHAIAHQVALCLRDLPDVTEGDSPEQIKDVCADKVWDVWFYKLDTPQQELTPVVVECLQGYSQVSQQQITTAEQCLVQALAKSYYRAKRGYSPRQREEILDRVESCLRPLPKEEARERCLKASQDRLQWRDAWKEDLEDYAYACIGDDEFRFDHDVLSIAKQCLRQELDKDLTTS